MASHDYEEFIAALNAHGARYLADAPSNDAENRFRLLFIRQLPPKKIRHQRPRMIG